MRVLLRYMSETELDKTYTAKGLIQTHKMFFAGVFGMKNAIQQSTKNAMDQVLVQLITDLNELLEVRNATES
jgi:hypothetical protein